MKATRVLPVCLSFAFVCGFAADAGKEYQVELRDGRDRVKGKMALSDTELRFTNSDGSFSIPRADIRSVRDVEGTLTFQVANPYTWRNSPRSTLVVKVDPEQSHHITTWVGVPRSGIGEANRDAPGVIRWEEVSITTEHRHAAKDNCRGKLISGPDTLRYDSETNPAHSKTWNYGDIEAFERNAKANEVKVKARGVEEYVFTSKRDGSDASVFEIISKRCVAVR